MSGDGPGAVETARDNWRIALLVVAVAVSLFLLVGPQPGGASPQAGNATAGNGTVGNGTANATGATGAGNLEYGLELAGGTRVQAPLVGWTAEGLNFTADDTTAVERRVAGNLGNVSAGDVEAIEPSGTSGPRWALEVRADLPREAVVDALDEADVDYDRVRSGVTPQTRSATVEVLQSKIDETGLQGGRVRTLHSVSQNQWFVIVEVPNANNSAVRELIDERGQVEIRAYHHANGSFTNRTVLTNEDFANVGVAQEDRFTGPHVDVAVDQGAAPQFQEDLVETGIARQGGSDCGYPGQNQRDTCLLIVRDGTVVSTFGMQESLAESMVNGTWENDPQFVLPTQNLSGARQLSINLRAGALPTGLAIDQGTVQFVSATFGESARLNSVIAAIAAVIAVTLVIFLRFGDPRVALPMVVTALSEVVLLLGFAAGVGLALDLGHIAGFIAVIGTGVDDLVIIADDILRKGSIATDRVFQNRFRKAFWVIGAAAATTIIAMSPLAVLGLQQLRGFAIVTIVGVLLGVFVTRPAYGDILHNLVLDEEQ